MPRRANQSPPRPGSPDPQGRPWTGRRQENRAPSRPSGAGQPAGSGWWRLIGSQGGRFAGLGPQLIQRLRWLWRQEGSPGHRARGLAAGVFTGCLPVFGLQIVLGVALAAAIRGNRILAAAGTWISNPLTTLPITWINDQLGAWLIGPGPAWPARSELDLERLGDLGWAFTSRLLLGSRVAGILASAVVGLACWRWMRQRERHPEPQGGAIPDPQRPG